MDISKLSDWLKLSPRYLLPISLVTGFVLFAPSNLLDQFGLTAFTNQYRPIIGVIFLLSAVLLIVDWLIKSYQWVKRKRLWSTKLKAGQKRLQSLTDPEKELLNGYISGKTRSQYLSMESGVVNGLEAEGVIYRAANVGVTFKWAYNIQPWAWTYLNQHPELLIIETRSKNENYSLRSW